MESLLILMYLWMPFSSLDNVYMGGGTGIYAYSGDDSGSFQMLGFQARMGTYLNDYLSSEIRFGLSSQDEDKVNGERVDAHVKRYAGAYLQAGYPINEELKPYAILGYSSTEISFKAVTTNSSPEESGFSYGAGVSMQLDRGAAFDAEYLMLQDFKDGDLHTFSLNLRFDL